MPRHLHRRRLSAAAFCWPFRDLIRACDALSRLGRNAFRAFVMMLISLLCVAPYAFAQSASIQSQRVAEIRLLAATCSTCHGTDGNALGAARRLSGVAAEDLSKALLGFRDGSLSSTVMREITQAYTPETLVELATHFAAQKARSAK